MRALKFVVALLTVLLLASAWGQEANLSIQKSLGQNAVQVTLAIQYDKHAEESRCDTLTNNFFGNATHPGGNIHGYLRERNHGTGYSCYQKPEYLLQTFDGYVSLLHVRSEFLAALINSQDSNTLAFGHTEGLRIRVKTDTPLRAVFAGIGYAGTTFSYERNRATKGGVILVPFYPMRYREAGAELPHNTYIAVNELNLPGNIRLRFLQLGLKFKFNIF